MNTSKPSSLVNLIETAANDNSFTTFGKALVAAELDGTLQAQSAIKMIDMKVMIDASDVTLIDIASSNSVIHANDVVLIPTKH